MDQRDRDGRGDGQARIAELEADLARARTQIEELSLRVRTGESPDPVLTVDARGNVVAMHGAWPWGDPPTIVGQPLWIAFDADSAAMLEQLAASGWLGASERKLRLRDGRRVAISVRPASEGRARIALHDVTARHVIEDAGERRKRMRVLADLAGTVARELTDPMSIVQGRLELLLDLGVSEPSAIRRHLDVALEHARRVTATLRNLRLVGTTPISRTEAVRIDQVVEEALDLLGPRRERVLVRIEPPDLTAGSDAPLAARVLASLLRQSLESAGRGTVHLRARRKRGLVTLRIGPSGRVISDDPSVGDDLSFDRTLLAGIGGQVMALRSTHGLIFDVVLPAPPTRRARRRPVRGRIAVVGSPALHEAVTGLLGHDGYEFVCARTGDEGLVTVNAGTGIDAVVAELLLEGTLSGLTLAEALIERHPTLRGRVLLVSEGPLSLGLRAPVVAMQWPLGRGDLLEALGHRVRR